MGFLKRGYVKSRNQLTSKFAEMLRKARKEVKLYILPLGTMRLSYLPYLCGGRLGALSGKKGPLIQPLYNVSVSET
jgi:hypothetical protein